jgi:integration host factor subunit beta
MASRPLSFRRSGFPNPKHTERGFMTKADLVERVTASIARTAGPMISKKDCARVVDAFLDAVKEVLSEQNNIEIRGFGTFKIRRRKTRMARNPRTGDPVEVAARPVPVFKPSKELRAKVAEKEAEREAVVSPTTYPEPTT